MTDKEKIREEVERLLNELIQEKKKGFGSDVDDACILELQNVLTYIDSLQEEPISSVWRKPTEIPKEGCAIVSVTDGCSFLEDDAFSWKDIFQTGKVLLKNTTLHSGLINTI